MQQEILGKNPNASIAVYAIWMPIFPDDARARWPVDALTDRRVSHWWDDEQRVGRWYAQRMRDLAPRLAPGSIDVGGTILWDGYVAYGPGTQWSDSGAGVHRWGRPILATREHLQGVIAQLANDGSR